MNNSTWILHAENAISSRCHKHCSFSHAFCATNIMSYHMQYKSRTGRNKFSKLKFYNAGFWKNVDCELNFVKLIQWYRWRYCSNEKVQVTSSSNYPKLSYSLREKCSNAELFLVRIFLYSVRIWTLFKKQGSEMEPCGNASFYRKLFWRLNV